MGLNMWMGPLSSIELQKYRHNLVFITQKQLKLVFSFCISLLKNPRIEWWKQNLKTNPNKLHLFGSHHFWMMNDENWVMNDGYIKIQTAPKWFCRNRKFGRWLFIIQKKMVLLLIKVKVNKCIGLRNFLQEKKLIFYRFLYFL